MRELIYLIIFASLMLGLYFLLTNAHWQFGAGIILGSGLWHVWHRIKVGHWI